MEPERWQRLERLFDELRRMPADERARFLDAECAGDAELRAKLESLIERADEPAKFIERAIGQEAARLMELRLVTGDTPDPATPSEESAVRPEDAPTLLDPGPGVDSREARQKLPTVDRSAYTPGEEVARGGMGRIVRARDLRLGRPVAIKELLQDSPRLRRRFEREALISARLQHPSIVTVYEAGRWPTGEPFYAMHEVRGRSLTEVVRNSPTLGARLAVLPHVLDVAEALAYAHGKGIVHRDLKPSNVLVGSFGETVVIDWGLAKDLRDSDRIGPTGPTDDSSESELTQLGTVMGTPAYMAPEQAHGEPGDERTDVYAIGAILYFVLTGRPPYEAADSHSLVRQVKVASPRPVGATPGVPADLVAIVQTAMGREPAARYASARELAMELRRFQTGQLVAAHSYSTGQLLLRWIRRYRAAVAVGAAALALLGLVTTVSFRRIVRERDRAEQSRALAEQASTRAASRADEIILAQARTWLDRDPVATVAWLQALAPDSAWWPAARVIAADAVSRGLYTLFAGHDGHVWDFALSADGTRLASAGNDGTVRLWDLGPRTGRIFGGHTGMVRCVRFSPDGRALASGGQDGTVRLWDVDSGHGTPLHGHGDFVTHVAFTPDGLRLASSSWDGTVRVWDLASGESRVLDTPSSGRLLHVAFSPDGSRVAASGQGAVHVWDVASGRSHLAADVDGEVSTVAFSPDGRTLAAAGPGEIVTLWDLATGRPTTRGGHTNAVTHVAFSPDGSRLASSSHDRTVRLWRLDSPEAQVLDGHDGEVLHLDFSPDGRRLASAGVDGTVRVRDLADGQTRVLAGDGSWILHVAFSRDGHGLASSSADGNVRLWDLSPLADVRVLLGHDRGVLDAAFSPDGTRFVTGGFDNTVRVWVTATGESRTLTGHDAGIRSVALSPDGRRVISGGVGTSVRLWDIESGDSVVLAGHEGGIEHVAFSPTGRHAASASLDKTVRVWTVDGGESRSRVLRGHEGKVSRVAFSPDGARLASAGSDGTARLWDMATGRGRVVSVQGEWVRSVAFSPDGRLLASGGAERGVHVWSEQPGERRVLEGHEAWVRIVAFSPDGRLLASASDDGQLRIWNLATDEARVLDGHDGAVERLAFSADGGTLATAGQDATVRLWNVASGVGRVLRGHEGGVKVVAFSPDGARLLSAGLDGTVRLWTDDLPAEPAELRRWLARATNASVGADNRIVFAP